MVYLVGIYFNLNGMDVLLFFFFLDGILIYYRLFLVFCKIFMIVYLYFIKCVGGERFCGNKVFCLRLYYNDLVRFLNWIF